MHCRQQPLCMRSCAKPGCQLLLAARAGSCRLRNTGAPDPRCRPPPCRDLRPQRWKFAVGPLPAGLPIPRLEDEWFLLTI